jgi:hypothetical protein
MFGEYALVVAILFVAVMAFVVAFVVYTVRHDE